jgi:HTH-type transcriptional regulator/antitoxin HigA
LVADYEEKYYPIQLPTLAESIKLRMQERDLSQKALAEFFWVSS